MRLSRRARAGVPDGRSPRRPPGPASAWRCSTCRPASSARPSTRAGRPQARRRTRRAAAARDRRAGGAGRPSRGVAELRLGAGHTADPGRSTRAARRTLLEQLRRRASTASASRHPAAVARGRRARAVPARHAEGRPRARPRDRLSRAAPTAWSSIRRRSAPRGRRGAEGGAPGRCSHEIDRTVTPMGGRLLRAGCCGRCSRSSRSRIGSTPSRSSRSAPPSAPSCATRSRRPRPRAARGARGARHGGAARPRSLRQSLAAVPRVRMLLAGCRRRSSRSLLAELDDLADVRDAIDRDARRRAAGARPRRRHDPRRRRPELDELRDDQPLGQAAHRRDGGGRARAHRHRLAQDPLQPRVRLLHRGLEVEPARVPADYHRKQTIAGGERFITPALKEYEEKVLGADERILARELEIFEALRTRWPPRRPRIQDTARALATLDVLAGWPRRRPSQLHQAAHARRRRAVATDARHPVVERTVAARRSCPTT
jgi:hypothetical protein